MQKKSTVQVPIELLLAPISNVDAATRTFDVQWLSGERIKRYDWMRDQYYYLEFSKEAGAADLSRVESKRAPVLNAHSQWDLSSQLGVIEGGGYQNGIGTAKVRLSAREDVKPILDDVRDKIICNVSAGITLLSAERRPPDETSEGLQILHVLKFRPFEISFVPIGADSGAAVLADQQRRTTLCELFDNTAVPAEQQENGMKTNTPAADPGATLNQTQATAILAAAAAAGVTLTPATATPAAPDAAALAAQRDQGTRDERTRIALIDDLCTRHSLTAELRAELIGTDAKPGATPEQVRERVLEALAQRSAGREIRSGAGGGDVHLVGDERANRRAFIAEALFLRVAPGVGRESLAAMRADTATQLGLTPAVVEAGSRNYRHMSLLRMAEEILTEEGVRVRGKSALDIATLAMMSTSDFANVLADVANKRLRDSYNDHIPTYARWARRAANAADFKNINVVVLSGAPDLLKVDPGGEFKYGSVSDGKETYNVVTYGRIIPINRQAIVNDDLNAFDRLPRAFAGSARRLENSLVYAQILTNPNLSDAVALFHATHGNLQAATAIDLTNLGLARSAMRKQLGLAGEKLNLPPRYLLAGPDKEQQAYQFTSSQFVPAQSANVNEFRQGGRTALEPIIDNEVTGNQWYLAADSSDCDTVEYTYLDGAEGVYLESMVGFKIDGVELKARLDFAAKVIDFRGLQKNPGA